MEYSLKCLKTGLANGQQKHSWYSFSAPDKLVVMFPGAGYSCFGPIFYYLTNYFLDQKFDVLAIDYDLRFENKNSKMRDEIESNFFDELVKILPNLDDFQEIIWIGKSFGSRLICKNLEHINVLHHKNKFIFLTPPWSDELVFQNLLTLKNSALTIIGNQDPHFKSERSQHFDHLLTLNEADHGLDNPQDVYQSIDNIKHSIDAVHHFLDNMHKDAAFFSSLPKRRLATGAICFHQDKLLILKPTYKEGWTVPGGCIDSGESPLECIERELFEELELHPKIERLVLIDNVLDNHPKEGEALHFIFKIEDLAPEHIKLDPKEHSQFEFLPIEQAIGKLSGGLKKRINQGILHLHKKELLYLNNGNSR